MMTGTKKKRVTDIEKLEECIENGDPKAMSVLAQSYDYGIGVGKNKEKAKELYQKRFEVLQTQAENEDSNAMILVSIAYEEGLGIEQDYEKAEYWRLRAAGIEQREQSRQGEQSEQSDFEEILEGVLVILQERASHYGDSEELLKALSTKVTNSIKKELGPVDILMVLLNLKFCRLEKSNENMDTIIDIIGYCVLLIRHLQNRSHHD